MRDLVLILEFKTTKSVRPVFRMLEIKPVKTSVNNISSLYKTFIFIKRIPLAVDPVEWDDIPAG